MKMERGASIIPITNNTIVEIRLANSTDFLTISGERKALAGNRRGDGAARKQKTMPNMTPNTASTTSPIGGISIF
jgi:hypothetical protein